MRLSEFIRTHPGEIEYEWEELAKTLTPSAAGLDVATLRDCLRQILLAIIDNMKTPHPMQQAQKSKGEKPQEEEALDRITIAHANMRLDSGFDLENVLAEYRALRASILRLWSRSGLATKKTTWRT